MANIGSEEALRTLVNIEELRYYRLSVDKEHDVCLLCKAKLGKNENHSDSYQHKLVVQEVSDRVTKILRVRDNVRYLPAQVERLSPYGPWRGKIYELIGRALMTEEDRVIQEANRLLLQYQELERISLLELAVWKFTCIVTVNPSKDDNDDNDTKAPQTYLEWKHWHDHGWKALKKQHYRCNQVVILMTAILPFLRTN